ncbi:MAG: hypothetical protein ACFFBR_03265 [Promethearchaeota archaeon]
MTFIEAPLHFGLLLTTTIILLLMTLIGFLWVVKTENARAGLWSGFLTIFFAFFTFLILTIMVFQVPAVATVSELLPYSLGAWTCVSLHAFFLLYYVLGFRWLQKRVWLAILPVIGTMGFVTILWIYATPANMILVFDGVMNWLAMPSIIVGVGGVLAIFYMFLAPTFAVYQVTKSQEGMVKMGNWISWIGLFLWFIAALLMALVLYVAPYMLFVIALATVAYILVFIGWLMATRGISSPASTG